MGYFRTHRASGPAGRGPGAHRPGDFLGIAQMSGQSHERRVVGPAQVPARNYRAVTSRVPKLYMLWTTSFLVYRRRYAGQGSGSNGKFIGSTLDARDTRWFG